MLVAKRFEVFFERFLAKSYAAVLWFLLGLTAVVLELIRNSINNYQIFKGVFTHTIEQVNLYAQYPQLYDDSNHYGPLFSLVIAPFALLPDYIGVVLWALLNVFVLYKAINYLPINKLQKNAILLIGAIEMMTAIHNVQINPSITALLIFSYVLVRNEKDFLACLCILLGFYIKLYGIIGLVFWVFSKHKIKFIGYFILCAVLLFVLPMIISSPEFIVQSYLDWYHSLAEKVVKNESNYDSNMQNISVAGMVERIFNLKNFSGFFILIPAAILYLLPLLRFKQYDSEKFRLLMLASTLLFPVLFSSSSESSTYVIAVTGFALWYVLQPSPKTKGNIALLIFVLLVTCLSNTDLVPRYFKMNMVRPYALKALPCFVIWLIIIYQLLVVNFTKEKQKI
ncbi:MAG: glycosyltransferase family 87 protein [Ferruginibacter sp.]